MFYSYVPQLFTSVFPINIPAVVAMAFITHHNIIGLLLPHLSATQPLEIRKVWVCLFDCLVGTKNKPEQQLLLQTMSELQTKPKFMPKIERKINLQKSTI